MPIEYRKWITRDMLKNEPEKLFVFGDNLARTGMGGQAKQMRGEPNAVGIPTKMSPTTYFNIVNAAYFFEHSYKEFKRLTWHVLNGHTVVWPSDGIGTGHADLKNQAPRIYNIIKEIEEMLVEIDGKKLNN